MTDNLLTETLEPDEIPEKFKDNETGALRARALLKSYQELERKMSSAPGRPKSAQEYCIDCSHGLFEPDDEINTRLYDKGMSNDQVQEVYDLAAVKMMPMMRDLAADFMADRELEKLVEHFGGEDSWKEVARQLLTFGQKNLEPAMLKTLSSSYDGILTLHKMMKGKEPALQSAESKADMSLDEKELSSMMRDPKYWRDKDPAFIQKVTDGFKKIYGE